LVIGMHLCTSDNLLIIDVRLSTYDTFSLIRYTLVIIFMNNHMIVASIKINTELINFPLSKEHIRVAPLSKKHT
jgi:hypothetical protein